MAEEEMNILNKLEQIKINVEGKLYNFEAAKILCLINKLKGDIICITVTIIDLKNC